MKQDSFPLTLRGNTDYHPVPIIPAGEEGGGQSTLDLISPAPLPPNHEAVDHTLSSFPVGRITFAYKKITPRWTGNVVNESYLF